LAISIAIRNLAKANMRYNIFSSSFDSHRAMRFVDAKPVGTAFQNTESNTWINTTPMFYLLANRNNCCDENTMLACENEISSAKKAIEDMVVLGDGDCRDFGDGYRFGFNGKEKDNEIKGTGNSLDFGARIYDSRLGKFLSLDPLMAKFPNKSPYDFAGNSPIANIDKEGKTKWHFTIEINEQTGKTTCKVQVSAGLLPRRRSDGDGFGEYNVRYEWQDYISTTITRIDKEGKVTGVTLNEPFGPVRTTTKLNIEFYAQIKADDNEKGKSFAGFVETSGSGGDDSKFAPKASKGSKMVDIDGILGAFGLTKNNLGGTYPNIYFDDLVGALDHVQDAFDGGAAIADGLAAFLKERSSGKVYGSGSGHLKPTKGLRQPVKMSYGGSTIDSGAIDKDYGKGEYEKRKKAQDSSEKAPQAGK
jgi:RHS repeat-associated protein